MKRVLSIDKKKDLAKALAILAQADPSGQFLDILNGGETA